VQQIVQNMWDDKQPYYRCVNDPQINYLRQRDNLKLISSDEVHVTIILDMKCRFRIAAQSCMCRSIADNVCSQFSPRCQNQRLIASLKLCRESFTTDLMTQQGF